MNRKHFINTGIAGLAGMAISPNLEKQYELPEIPDEFQEDGYREMISKSHTFRKIDAHNHLNESNRIAELIDESCRRVGIDWTTVSNILGNSTEAIRKNNDVVIRAMREYPNRILGSCYIHPGWQQQALDEIDRCVGEGMVMVGEVYNHYKVTDPVQFPLIERCIDHNIPFLMHSSSNPNLWYRGFPETSGTPSTSIAEDFIEISERYPEAMIIYAHIGGGGDWEYACRVLRDASSIYVDTSGSVTDAGMIDFAVEMLGADRVLFASDVNYEISVGKIMDADLSDEERKKIFFENFNDLLNRAGNSVD